MSDEEIIELRKQISGINSRIDALWDFVRAEAKKSAQNMTELYGRTDATWHHHRKEVESTTHYIRYIMQHMSELRDIISPIEDHIFPQNKKARAELKQIIGEPILGAGSDYDSRETKKPT